jgi:hypothetical protein
MKKLLSIVAFSLLFAASVLAQNKSDQWNGLTFDVSTPADAVKLFGEPNKNKDKQNLEIMRAESWLSGEQDKKIFRTLTYKRIKENKNVQLSFLDEKLVMVSFEAPDAHRESVYLDPDDLAKEFNETFKPYGRKFGQTRPFYTEYEEKAPSELSKQGYKTFYDMMAVGEKVFIIAVVNNVENLVGGAINPTDPTDLGEKDRKAAVNAGGKFPGYVTRVQIISRRLAAK